MTRAPTPAARTWTIAWKTKDGGVRAWDASMAEDLARELAKVADETRLEDAPHHALDLSAAIRLAGRVLVGTRWEARRGDAVYYVAKTRAALRRKLTLRAKAYVDNPPALRIVKVTVYRLPRAEVRR